MSNLMYNNIADELGCDMLLFRDLKGKFSCQFRQIKNIHP